MRTVSIDQARRMALGAQGFAETPPVGPVDVRHVRRVMRRIGLLQLDSVNVAVRSHYMPLFSRLGPYRKELIDEVAYERGELFEYWGHEASLLPIATYPLYRHRMEK
ncbi:MAG: winged helix DNA-binding domain-containing protein, partial [Acidimicrobiia bacterium]|nr:winged helix DNA-binding domain-containing protein [Acidimicrobiia bacterium]